MILGLCGICGRASTVFYRGIECRCHVHSSLLITRGQVEEFLGSSLPAHLCCTCGGPGSHARNLTPDGFYLAWTCLAHHRSLYDREVA